LLNFIVIFNNLTKSKANKVSLDKILIIIHNSIISIFVNPRPYFSLILISLLFARIIKLGLLNELTLINDDIFHYYFTSFALIIPGLYIYRIVLAAFLNAQTLSNHSISFLIISELLNTSNYRLNNININFNLISYICIFFSLGLFIPYLVPNLSNNMAFQSLDSTMFKVYSINDINVNPSLQDSPLSDGSNSSFGSSVFAESFSFPNRTFEQRLWSDRFDSLGDAKALDLSKRILLHKICLN